MRRVEFSIPTDDTFSFEALLYSHGWPYLAPFECDPSAPSLATCMAFPEGGVASLRLEPESGRATAVAVCARVHGPGGTRRALEVAARRVLQLDRDLRPFHAFCRARPELAHLAEKRQGRLLLSPSFFEDVVKVLCTTNITWAGTRRMVARLTEGYGRPVPGGGRCFPTPADLASATAEDLAARTGAGYRAAFLQELAARFAGGELRASDFEDSPAPSAQLRLRLREIRGIGPYASAALLGLLGRYDFVAVDTEARAAARALGLPERDAELAAYFERYAPWQALVYWFHYLAQIGPLTG